MMTKIKPIIDGEHPCGAGVQKIYKFANNYGASVIRTPWSYGGHKGLWELAVLRFHGEDDFRIDYNTSITNDVEGYLTLRKVNALLKRIEELEAPND